MQISATRGGPMVGYVWSTYVSAVSGQGFRKSSRQSRKSCRKSERNTENNNLAALINIGSWEMVVRWQEGRDRLRKDRKEGMCCWMIAANCQHSCWLLAMCVSVSPTVHRSLCVWTSATFTTGIQIASSSQRSSPSFLTLFVWAAVSGIDSYTNFDLLPLRTHTGGRYRTAKEPGTRPGSEAEPSQVLLINYQRQLGWL